MEGERGRGGEGERGRGREGERGRGREAERGRGGEGGREGGREGKHLDMCLHCIIGKEVYALTHVHVHCYHIVSIMPFHTVHTHLQFYCQGLPLLH